MDFRTLVDLPVKQLKINHSHKIMMLGSCFAENIGRKLQENKFRCDKIRMEFCITPALWLLPCVK